MTIEIQLKEVCSRCGISKFRSEFYTRKDRSKKRGKGLMSHCKECEKKRYKQRAPECKANSHKSYLKNKEKVCNRSIIASQKKYKYIEQFKMVPCMDCGQSFFNNPEVMDFDHRNPTKKRFNLSGGNWRSYKEIDEEIAKCDIVCSNCHRIRTKRAGLQKLANLKSWETKRAQKSAP